MDNGENLPDPYSIKQDKWTDDVKLWPNIEYGDIYMYLININQYKRSIYQRQFKGLQIIGGI